MLIGYARTSTDDQRFGLEGQVEALKGAGCEEIRSEHASGASDREVLDSLIAFLRKGDTLIVTKLDRLGRSTLKVAEMVARIEAKGADFKVLDMPWLDTSNAAGKMVFTMMAAMGQFEREQMLERQRVGIDRAKLEGKFRGRPASKARKLSATIRSRHAAGEPLARIAADLNVSRNLCYRVLNGETPAVAA